MVGLCIVCAVVATQVLNRLSTSNEENAQFERMVLGRLSRLDATVEKPRPEPAIAGPNAPARFALVAARDADTVRVTVEVASAQATAQGAGGLDRVFLQLRGHYRLGGRISGEVVVDEGDGFFETYLPVPRP